MAAASRPATAIAWVDYMGAQDDQVRWAHTMRGYQRHSTGMDNNPQADEAKQNSVPLGSGVGTVIIPVGALSFPGQADSVQNYFNRVESDQGRAWGDLLRKQTRTMASRLSGHQIYWQVSNEINSRKFGQNVARFGGAGSGSFALNRPELIGVYAEKVLAPASAAIRGAAESGGPKPKIVIATIAYAAQQDTRDWLLKFLDYQLKGTLVPSLKGRTVASLGDVVGIHYLLSRDDGDWQKDLGNLYRQVVDVRHMQGLWLTEEVGLVYARNGMGGAIALKDWARFMSWVSVNGYTPEQTRMNLWGWQLGPDGSRGSEAMDYLYSQIGASKVKVIGDSAYTQASFGQLFAFSVDKGGSLVIAVGDGHSGRSDAKLPAGAAGKDVSCRLFTKGGSHPAACTAVAGSLHSDALAGLGENDVLVAVMK
ncbi:MAG TPA: hypothetical protein VGH80_07975 [Xanthomonadaceae bacterium]